MSERFDYAKAAGKVAGTFVMIINGRIPKGI